MYERGGEGGVREYVREWQEVCEGTSESVSEGEEDGV